MPSQAAARKPPIAPARPADMVRSMQSLVSTEWLAAESGASDLRILDASAHLAAAGRDAAAEYEAGHIPGAVFMNLAELVDSSAPVENTLPPAEKFASRMASLGIADGNRIVLYDVSEIKTAARAWFMFRMFGCHYVAILDGGLAKWKAEGRPLETGTRSADRSRFTVSAGNARLRSKHDVLANIASGAEQLVDARGASRFSGTEPEPRPGMAPGHVPGARNLPYKELFNANGTWKSPDGLRAAFAGAGVDLSRPVIASCGSGVTACVLAFGMHLLGNEDVALYDGSWAEWGADPSTPKVTGAA